jgi:FdhE protein
LKPFLKAYAEVFRPEVEPEFWRRQYCPICGGKPDFAYLEKEMGGRWLVCSRCDTEWLFMRLKCPYCGTQTQSDLAHFTSEEEPHLYRLHTCERCHTYIKVIDLRCSETEILIPLERVLTIDMDKMGEEKGYAPGWASGVSTQTPEKA